VIVKKEEIGAALLATMSLIGISAAVWRVVINGEELSSTGRTSPAFVLLLGLGLLGLMAYQYQRGSLGEPARNGRTDRPFVFWCFLFAFSFAGAGFVFLSLFAILR
jgi:hypothetical protein